MPKAIMPLIPAAKWQKWVDLYEFKASGLHSEF